MKNNERNMLYARIAALVEQVNYWKMVAEHNEAIADSYMQEEATLLTAQEHTLAGKVN